ncbi:putative DIC1-mitochondrial dicarboxylate carrier protein [Tilletiaria anomala UBC 951]|uniref:Putative DIC1-mitochondrial dicarboxylate carrier protein n=1 Tax=Tilletiaria anomala (strain ATCC 24038 / CBS 436.72 / UBC 951) TaxID=1037660 RepID=A0A066VPK9_TILAU|nr:putative DIC1-mitochondrial dicarboxylate carrier protein [Tilletiaria anomala UBC 951]KDN40520.1 putative DIC1-mitochondrial dicarboxylate carrier protein [Tilletiaria anomala UBC 951]
MPTQYPFWLGGAAASIAACFTHPLDAVKNRMQTAKTKQGMGSVLVQTAKKEGIPGLYVGLTASLLRQMTYSVVRFGAYDALKEHLRSPSDSKGPLPAWKMALCASLAGAAGGLAGNPADVLLVRMTSDLNLPSQKRYNYSNALTGLVRVFQEEGPTSLFRGLTPNVVRAILMNASQLATYDMFKESLVSSGLYAEGTWLHFSASFLAGTVATTVCSPADVIKARIMNGNDNGNGGNHGFSALKAALKREGPGFLFRGFMPAWIRLSPNTIIMFITLEKLRLIVDWSRGKGTLVSA